MVSRLDVWIRELASGQHGLVGRWQLREMGLDGSAIGRRVRSGMLEALSKRVFRLAGAAPTGRSALLAGVLEAGSGSVVSFGTAAAMWELPGFTTSPVEVTGPRRRLDRGTYELAIVHYPKRLFERHWVELDEIPVTTPTRTIFDLAGAPWIHPARLERALDTLWARGRVSHASMTAMLSDLARRGRTGITAIRELLADRPADYVAPESRAEGRFKQLVESWGMHRFQRQVDIGGDERWIGRVDFIDPTRQLVVEIDPSLHHSSLTDRRHDTARREALVAAGMVVVSVTEADLFHRPQALRSRLNAALKSAA